MQVPYDEGVAIHIGPESCAVAREGLGEALTGVRVGQPLSRESFLFWVPTPCIWWKATYSGASARAPGRPGVVRDPGMCSREISRSTVRQPPPVRIGKARSRSRRSRESQGQGLRGTRASKARTGHRDGSACHKRWNAYGKPRKGRRRSSLRSSTTSTGRAAAPARGRSP